MAAAANWREWLTKLRVPGMLGPWGQKFLGILGLEADTMSLGVTCSLRCGFPDDPYCLSDHLALKGTARGLPRYPAESTEQYRVRVVRALTDWQLAGTNAGIIGQLTAAGYINPQLVFRPNERGPRGEKAPYWSQFWVYLPSLGVTRTTRTWNSGALWNDGGVWGPVNILASDASTLRAIVRKFKPSDWICRGFLFPVASDFDWNDGTTWNDGSTWGGFLEMEF